MNLNDFPGILRAAEKVSRSSQRSYIGLMKTNLIFGIVGAAITIYNFEQVDPKVYVYCFSLLLLLGALCLTVIVKRCNFEDLWYQARALSESIKTLMWRYVTCSEGFESSSSSISIQTKFNQQIMELRKQFPDLEERMDVRLLKEASISEEMNQVRSLGWKDRQTIYFNERIVNQIEWYAKKSKYNKKMRNGWFAVVVGCQALSVIASLFLIINPASSWNLVGLFTTISAAAIAWVEMKQFHELAQAYTTTVAELGLIRSLNNHLQSEDQFSKFVLDSENAISREHTMWLAQRRYK
ncbi:DUF4231 domain-containing protein [Chitinophaga sp. 30R24]|uniref:DUF4231 domain-containing protein n=1 Tax=Chitinophaga sp. 30R24 TaxID=3248838 RepID=UPI003B90AC05